MWNNYPCLPPPKSSHKPHPSSSLSTGHPLHSLLSSTQGLLKNLGGRGGVSASVFQVMSLIQCAFWWQLDVCVGGGRGRGGWGEVQVGMELWVSTLFLCHVILFFLSCILCSSYTCTLLLLFFCMLFAVTLYITFLNVLPLIFFSPKGDNVGQCHCKAQWVCVDQSIALNKSDIIIMIIWHWSFVGILTHWYLSPDLLSFGLSRTFSIACTYLAWGWSPVSDPSSSTLWNTYRESPLNWRKVQMHFVRQNTCC